MKKYRGNCKRTFIFDNYVKQNTFLHKNQYNYWVEILYIKQQSN